MTIYADANGVLSAKFTIPGNVPAGDKLVEAVSVSGRAAEAVFSGQGTAIRIERNLHDRVVDMRWHSPPPPKPPHVRKVDPLAQTFMLSNSRQITAVDLWFVVAPTTDAVVQIRETTVGLPNSTVIGEGRVKPADVVTSGAHTRIAFDAPLLLLAEREYAIVVLCNDANGAIAIAEMGKYDSVNNQWITAQAYTVGVLLSSSNASTWTAHQDRDMAFRLIGSEYTEAGRTIALGKVTVAGATDLMLMAYSELPTSDTRAEYSLSLPGGSVVNVSDGQPVKLDAPITGDVNISAILAGVPDFSPSLHPGTQLVAGVVELSADYVTRAIPAGTGVTVKVIFDADIPSGAAVNVQYSGIDGGDTFAAVPFGSSRALDAPFSEFIYTKTGVTETAVRIKLILTGTSAARPRVKNLRVIVT